jgi:hypothetical protein
MLSGMTRGIVKTTGSKQEPEPYQAPLLVVLGSLHQLTLDHRLGAHDHHHGGIFHHGSV